MNSSSAAHHPKHHKVNKSSPTTMDSSSIKATPSGIISPLSQSHQGGTGTPGGTNGSGGSGPAHGYCLKWKFHPNNLLHMFNQLLLNETFTDVLVACDGKVIKCHKMVLSACSKYFEQIFSDYPQQNSTLVILKDMKFADVQAIIEFMYQGEINVSHDQLPSLLKSAESLQVKGLADITGGSSGTSASATGTGTGTSGSGLKSSAGGAEDPLDFSNAALNSNTNRTEDDEEDYEDDEEMDNENEDDGDVPAPMSGLVSGPQSPIVPLFRGGQGGGTDDSEHQFHHHQQHHRTPSGSGNKKRKRTTAGLKVPLNFSMDSSSMDGSVQGSGGGSGNPYDEYSITNLLETHYSNSSPTPASSSRGKKGAKKSSKNTSHSLTDVILGHGQDGDEDQSEQQHSAAAGTLELMDDEVTEDDILNIVKMTDYIEKGGSRPQFWEEPITKKIINAIRSKKIEMKLAAEILGVSYSTLYSRYRELHGYLKMPHTQDTNFNYYQVLNLLRAGQISLTDAAKRLNIHEKTLGAYLTTSITPKKPRASANPTGSDGSPILGGSGSAESLSSAATAPPATLALMANIQNSQAAVASLIRHSQGHIRDLSQSHTNSTATTIHPEDDVEDDDMEQEDMDDQSSHDEDYEEQEKHMLALKRLKTQDPSNTITSNSTSGNQNSTMISDLTITPAGR